MGKIYKVISSILIIFLSIIVFVLLISFIQMNIFNNKYCNLLGYSFFEIATGSMEPTIMKEDIIFVKLDGKYSENDIIVFKSGNEFITHRVVSINDESIVTKGDNNNSKDDPIKKEDVIGKVVFTVKDVSIWKKVFKDYRVIIPLSITVMLLIILILYKERKGT